MTPRELARVLPVDKNPPASALQKGKLDTAAGGQLLLCRRQPADGGGSQLSRVHSLLIPALRLQGAPGRTLGCGAKEDQAHLAHAGPGKTCRHCIFNPCPCDSNFFSVLFAPVCRREGGERGKFASRRVLPPPRIELVDHGK